MYRHGGTLSDHEKRVLVKVRHFSSSVSHNFTKELCEMVSLASHYCFLAVACGD